MADDDTQSAQDTTATTTTTTETVKATDSTERKYTQEEVNQIVQKRLARVQPEGSQKQSAPQQPESKPTTNKAAQPPTWTLDHEDHLAELTKAEGIDLTAGLKRRMRSDPTAPSLDDIEAFHAWGKRWFDDAGLKKAASNQSTPTVQQPNTGGATKGDQVRMAGNISDKGSASNARDHESVFSGSPSEWTSTDIQWLQNKHGFEKANQMIADRVRSYLSTVKLIPENRRR